MMDISKLVAKDPTPLDPDKVVEAIVMVSVDGYEPKLLTVRGRITKRTLTGTVRQGDLDELRKDPQVCNVGVSEIIPLIKQP